MVQLFADQLQVADTPWKLVRFWFRTVADILRTIPARHAESQPHLVFGIGHVAAFGNMAWSSSAKRSVFFACYEARSFGRGAITVEDLLLGILREDKAVQEFAGGSAVVEEMRRAIEERESAPRQEQIEPGDLPLDAACRSALSLAKEEAPRSGAQHAGPRHLLAGILQQEQTLAAQLLQRHGLTLERLRRLS
jgi:ATP-dependent Clp protease ATP-binding subunit ClpA